MTRARPHSIGSFVDCFEIMDKALINEGLILTFETHTQATQFRHRCYSARTTLARLSKERTQYDSMLIIKTKEEPKKLIFKFRTSADLPITMTDLQGHPLLEDTEIPIDDLMAEAEELKLSLKVKK